MFELESLNKIELEITSNCNAACPGCARTLNPDKFSINTITFADIKQMFPSRSTIEGKKFKFCGVLGDPAFNKECVDMVDYLVSYDGFCEISTNGGIQSADWWSKLGKIASSSPNLLHIHFCVDGYKETNHIYRVNTIYDVIDRNMQAFCDSAPPNHASWIYIVFDHNEHELLLAEQRAKELNFMFATRTGMRNSYNEWIAQIKKKKNV